MKKISILLLTALSLHGFAQSNSFGTISGGIGMDFGFGIPSLQAGGATYNVVGSEIGFISLNASYPFDLNFGLAEPVSIGVQYAPTNFRFTDGGGSIVVKSTSIGLNINLYLVNTDKFNMEFSLTPKTLLFKEFSLDAYQDGLRVDLKGGGMAGRLKFNILFSDNIGIYFDLGYDRYKVQLDKYSLVNDYQNLEDDLDELIQDDISLRLGGIHMGMGIALKFEAFGE